MGGRVSSLGSPEGKRPGKREEGVEERTILGDSSSHRRQEAMVQLGKLRLRAGSEWGWSRA